MPRTLIVANRLPVTVRLRDGLPQLVKSTGGLASGMRTVHAAKESLWIGWPDDLSRLSDAQHAALKPKFTDRRLIPVALSSKEVEGFYQNFSNGVLWPLFHYQLDRTTLDSPHWETYRAVNKKFAETVTTVYEEGDQIWVHDYQLMLVPGMIRESIPQANIGFFLHIPFPASEVFRMLPWRRDLLKGVLGADLVGFHNFSYARYFSRAVQRILGMESRLNRISLPDREVQVRAFPMGIDAERFEKLATHAKTVTALDRILSGSGGRKIVLGVDRLDYTKGIPRRLLAFERLLERQPELVNKLRLIQVAVPSRGGAEPYRKFRRELEGIVGRINGRFGTPESAPIHYLHRSVTTHELIALYRSADVMLVTALRDGMNLVAKEFVASRIDNDGVLLLSEFAGASEELGEALQINPYDIEAVADRINEALSISTEERKARMRTLRQRVHARSTKRWAEAFLNALKHRSSAQVFKPAMLATSKGLVQRLKAISNPVLLLDYDGTLVPIKSVPELARPDSELLRLLKLVATAMEVHIVSGRSRENLSDWLGELPLSLWAEHGASYRKSQKAIWTKTETPSWLPSVVTLLEEFADYTPGALVEKKGVSVAWHYRAADNEFGEQQAEELRRLLVDAVHGEQLDVMQGSKVIEVRPRGVHKGGVVEQVLLKAGDPKRIIAIGDDRTDEEMFAAVPAEGVTIHVGSSPSRATYRVADNVEVRKLLKALLATS